MLFRKAIVAIADGLGDHPIPSLGNKTPLEYANTPNLDRLALEGVTGIVDLISPGIPVGTDVGHLILFGHEVSQYSGRGPIEALGIGMAIKPGDIVFRCNFATINEEGIVIDRRAGRIRENTEEIAAAINGMIIEEGVQVFLKAATEHRAVLVLRGIGLSDRISDSDPHAPNDGMPFNDIYALDSSEEAQRTAKLMNIFLMKAYECLKSHPVNEELIKQGKLPANFILTRGAGQIRYIEPVASKLGINGSCIAGESTVLGVARIAGFQAVTHSSMTGNMDTNIRLKAQLVLEQIADDDIVYVHIKATDIKGHDNKPLEKADAIEMFDMMVGLIAEQLPEDTYLAVISDHSTPCEVGEHTGDPVPALIYGPGIRVDRTSKFSEIDCAYGGLGRLSGQQFISTLHGLMGRIKKIGS